MPILLEIGDDFLLEAGGAILLELEAEVEEEIPPEEETPAGVWTQVTASTGVWATQGVAVVPPPWAMLTSVTTTVDDGVDFTLEMREQYPMRVSTDRPIPMYDVHPEGTP